MTSRRMFLTGLMAAGARPRLSWADAGAPDFVAAGKLADGRFVLCGLRGDGRIVFQIPLPGRGHAAAAHPDRPEAVAFARRPGNFALVLDCRSGAVIARLETPENRHFYGHGAFSLDGGTLYTTENAFDEGDGRIGIWDVRAGYRRVGEVWSGGVGPHEILRLPGSDVLVVANGGIDTHPDSGRAKLNLPVMAANLSYLDGDGAVLDRIGLPKEWHLNSIRHLSVRADGLIAAAQQWQGDIAAAPPLLMLHRRGQAPRHLAFAPQAHRRLDGYAGSVAFSGDGRRVAITSPRGGVVQSFDAQTGAALSCLGVPDACGVAAAGQGVLLTSGTGALARLDDAETLSALASAPVAWDNHIVTLPFPTT